MRNILNKLFILCIIFITIACDKLDFCYYADDFGDTGDVDIITISPSESNCYWDTEKSIDALDQNISVRNCLKTTTISKMIEDNPSLSNVEIAKNSFCSNLDPQTKNSLYYNENNSNEDKNNLQAIFTHCINYCQNVCDSNATQDFTMWEKANVKTSNNYLGINITEKSYITVSVSGTIILNAESKESDVNFRNYGIEEINTNYLTKDGDRILPAIDIKNQNIDNRTADQIKYTTHLSFYNIESSLILPSNQSSCLKKGYNYDDIKYEFLQPNYSTISCEYYSPNEYFENTAICKFNHKNVLLGDNGYYFTNCASMNSTIETIDNYYNSSTKYKTSVFNGDYYKYVSDVFNYIQLDNENKVVFNGNNIKNEEERIQKEKSLNILDYGSNDKQIILSSNKNVDGYIWLRGSNNIDLQIAGPTKLAIKNLNNNRTDNCRYYFHDSQTYSIIKENGIEKEAINTSITYETTLSSDNNNWMTIKDSNSKEIVFNKFYANSSKNTLRISIAQNDHENINKKCSQGLAIKLLPLKEHELQLSGFLFFNEPDIKSEKPIKFNVINKNVLTTNSSNITLLDKVNNYFESGLDSENKTLKLSDKNELQSFDGFKEIPNELINNSLYVRKNQTLRFDYSNWLEIDGKESINIIINTAINQSDIGNIPRGLGLNSIVKERSPMFCVGSGTEAVSIETACLANNGNYSDVQIKESGNTNTKGKCFIALDSCLTTVDLEQQYLSINKYSSNCKSSNIVDSSNIQVTDLNKFWTKIYNDYSMAIKNEKAQTNEYPECYSNIINNIYTRAQGCLKNINSNKYDIYFGEVENNTESYKIKVQKIPNNVTSIEEKINDLNNLFNVKKIQIYANESGEQSSENYNNISLFYYYAPVCEELDGKCKISGITQCYDLSNYKGRLETFIANNSKNLDNNSFIGTNGTMSNIEEAFGAKKINPFDGNNGLIRDFTKELSNTDNGYTTFKYPTEINISGNGFFKLFIMKQFIATQSQNYDETLIKYLKYEKNIDALAKIGITSKETFTKGERLSVILGDSNKYYYGENGGENGIFYKTGSALTPVSNKNGIIELVNYNNNRELDTDNSDYIFSPKGNLISNNSSNAIGIDISNNQLIKDYVKENNNVTLFFKIIDIDNNISNNQGSYQIKIRSSENSESVIITYFRNFFNIILSFVDGTKIKLNTNNNGNPINCTENDINNCYTYNLNDTASNGETCNYEDDYCYKNCNNLTSIEIQNNCKEFDSGKGFVKNIYESFINDPLYQIVAKLSLILAITFYGLSYFFGLSKFTQSEMMSKIIRFCFVYFMISPSGWNFFNNYIVAFFKEGIESVLFLIAGSFETDPTSELSLALAGGTFSDKTALFSSSFNNLEMLFSSQVFNKMLGLAFSSWFGLIYLYLVFSTVINYVVAVFSAVIMFLSAQVYISLVFCFFPLVLLFMFFEKTKKTFDNWLDMLIGFAAQEIFLILTLSFFNVLIYNFIKTTFSYTVCWMSLFNLNLGGFPLALLSFWKIPTSSNALLNTANENLPSFYSIMSFYVIGILMGKFVSGMAALGNSIAGGKMSIAGGVSGVITGALNKGNDMLKKQMKSVGQKFATGVVDRMGGNAIKKFNAEQQEKRKKRREKNDNHFSSVREQTAKSMNTYRNSDEFKDDSKKRLDSLRETSDWKNANSKERNKMENKEIGNLLKEKEASFEKEAGIESIKKNYTNEIQDSMKASGINKDFKSLDKKEQDKYARQYGENMGLLSKDKKIRDYNNIKITEKNKDNIKKPEEVNKNNKVEF